MIPKGYQIFSLAIPMAWSLLHESLKGANMKRESIIQGFSLCAVLIFVILTSGCATTVTRMYKGEELPKQEIAVIKESSRSFPKIQVYICSVDEELLESPLIGLLKVQVMPGFHKVVVRTHMTVYHPSGIRLFDQRFLYYNILEFTAEAGHQYKIKTLDLSKGNCLSIGLVDIQSGAVIANSRNCSFQAIGIGIKRVK